MSVPIFGLLLASIIFILYLVFKPSSDDAPVPAVAVATAVAAVTPVTPAAQAAVAQAAVAPAAVTPVTPVTPAPTAPGATAPTAPGPQFAELTDDYKFGPYHFGPLCDADRRTMEDPNIFINDFRISQNVCDVLGGMYDTPFNHTIDDIPADLKSDPKIYEMAKNMVKYKLNKCKTLKVCRNKPNDDSIFIGKYQPSNPNMLGVINDGPIKLNTAVCDALTGEYDISKKSGDGVSCMLGLYKKKDLPDGIFLMPGPVERKTIQNNKVIRQPGFIGNDFAPIIQSNNLQAVKIYARSFTLPANECNKMGGFYDDMIYKNATDLVPCELNWYTNANLRPNWWLPSYQTTPDIDQINYGNDSVVTTGDITVGDDLHTVPIPIGSISGGLPSTETAQVRITTGSISGGLPSTQTYIPINTGSISSDALLGGTTGPISSTVSSGGSISRAIPISSTISSSGSIVRYGPTASTVSSGGLIF